MMAYYKEIACGGTAPPLPPPKKSSNLTIFNKISKKILECRGRHRHRHRRRRGNQFEMHINQLSKAKLDFLLVFLTKCRSKQR